MYKLSHTGAIKRLSDGSAIPHDPRNRDFVAYQRWLASGGIPEQEPAPRPNREHEREACADRLQHDYLLAALMIVVARRFGIPTAQLISEIKANI